MVLSPVNGKVVNTVDTLHAYGLETEDGIELLVHIGLNTVELKGKGFKNFVKLGDAVKAGRLEIHTGAAIAGETSIIKEKEILI